MRDDIANMIIIPSLEVLAGRLVRLEGGAGDTPTIVAEDPLGAARSMLRSGAGFLHVVDLDAAFGTGDNDAVIAKLTEAMIPYQVRGGIRTIERADELLALGADRIVLGPLPIRDPDAARALVDRFGLRVVASLDVQGDRVLLDDSESTSLEEALSALASTGIAQVIYNSVESPGEDAPIDLDRLSTVMGYGDFRVSARCTAQSDRDLAPVRAMLEQGLESVILNHALAPGATPFAELVAELAA